MCWWWVFTFRCNCVWIFWFATKNVIFFRNSKNEFQWTTKHVFWQDFSLHMWPTPQAKHFEPIEHFFCQMVKKKGPSPCNPFLQILKILKFLYNLVFHQVHIMNMYIHRRGHVFVVKNVWNQLYEFMHSFWFLY
jgi:hypothetical protein